MYPYTRCNTYMSTIYITVCDNYFNRMWFTVLWTTIILYSYWILCNNILKVFKVCILWMALLWLAYCILCFQADLNTFCSLGHLFLIFWFTRPATVVFPKVKKKKKTKLPVFIFADGRKMMSTKNRNRSRVPDPGF